MDPSMRGRGRGKPINVNEAKPGVLRRPHTQSNHGGASQAIVNEKGQIIPLSEPPNMQELLKTAVNVVSAAEIVPNNTTVLQDPPIPNTNPHQAAILEQRYLNYKAEDNQILDRLNQFEESYNHGPNLINGVPNVQQQLAIREANEINRANLIKNQDAILAQRNAILQHSNPPSSMNMLVQSPPMQDAQKLRHFNVQEQLAEARGIIKMATLPHGNMHQMVSPLPQEFSALTLNSAPKPQHKLSVDAPEFVPRSGSIGASPSNNISMKSGPYIPSRAPDQSLEVSGQSLPAHALPQVEFLNNPIILQVNNLVVNLTLKPHKYDQIALQLTSILSWQVKHVDLMREIITVIFEQGIGEPNFRYNGARLCNHLNQHITQSYNGPSFRELVFKRCQEEFEVRFLYLEHNVERICGFAFFLADIFCNVLTSNAHYFETLQVGVCGVLIALLTKPVNSTLKCVAKVLKGTGYALDSFGGDHMNSVMTSLKDVAMTASVGVDVRTQLLSIIELRASNWGRGHGDGNSSLSKEHPMGTVFYGPSGDIVKVVSDDTEDSESDTDESFPGATPEEDEEFFKAYEEFLRSQAK